ncbi:DUF6241 domain-containing protein [Guptibacillus hwajinpoensis]|uniref:DUF6241 domain-containing protein n=1 Tax=Guptibacillus hwajinpoensis TaxID=208199 RepID=UPI001CFC8857|nr:DUF6241 domain-containing protein [Pseudalkalibacillus hwajinpoensis]
MPSTKTLIISISSMVVLILGLTYWFISDLDWNLKENARESMGEETGSSVDPERYVDDGEESITSDGIPSENKFQDYIHGMTHQKVIAEDKWGIYQISEERIDNMLEVLDKVEGTAEEYKYQDFYTEALIEWDNGNFNNAVDVHNHIWNLNGGTIGKAERLMTTEEEQAYIEETYNKR